MMEANPKTLDVLFSSQLRYVVPMFQRLYVWQENPAGPEERARG
jgi:hypothetical protein